MWIKLGPLNLSVKYFLMELICLPITVFILLFPLKEYKYNNYILGYFSTPRQLYEFLLNNYMYFTFQLRNFFTVFSASSCLQAIVSVIWLCLWKLKNQ